MVYFEKMGRGAHQSSGYVAAKQIVSIRQCAVDENTTEIYTVDGRMITVPGNVKEVANYIFNEGAQTAFFHQVF